MTYNSTNYTIHIATPEELANNPKMMEYLPPELRNLILKDIKNGSNDTEPLETEDKETKKEKIKYDYKMVNCNHNLKELTTKLKKSNIKQYGILLYGVSGSGKSYYGQWLAQELGMSYIKYKASDLIDKYVGQTEQNIKKAFKTAKEKKAILLIDEADTFLFDRKFADREFEVASVNEILTQMEDHPYPFIMTTNLKDKIDSASLRRFIFKISFDYMQGENVKAGIKTYFGKQFKLTDEQLKQFKYITAGDFKVAKAKLDILENGEYTNDLIFKYLLAEQTEKNLDIGSTQITL